MTDTRLCCRCVHFFRKDHSNCNPCKPSQAVDHSGSQLFVDLAKRVHQLGRFLFSISLHVHDFDWDCAAFQLCSCSCPLYLFFHVPRGLFGTTQSVSTCSVLQAQQQRQIEEQRQQEEQRRQQQQQQEKATQPKELEKVRTLAYVRDEVITQLCILTAGAMMDQHDILVTKSDQSALGHAHQDKSCATRLLHAHGARFKFGTEYGIPQASPPYHDDDCCVHVGSHETFLGNMYPRETHKNEKRERKTAHTHTHTHSTYSTYSTHTLHKTHTH
eukprot:114439-Pelagomonas_calceolata.AAC.2